METQALFVEASRMKLRFPSVRGDLTIEQLWDVPLTSISGFDLDTIARATYAALQDLSAGSFVTTKPSHAQHVQEIALDVLKCVIATKQEDAARLIDAQKQAQRRRQLLDALSTKEMQELSAATREDLLQQLAALDAE